MTNELSNTGMSGSEQSPSGMSSAYPGGASYNPASVRMGDNSTTSSLVSQSRASDDSFLFGDDRAVVNPPNWHSQRSTELYNGATVNNDPSTAETTGQDWHAHAAELEQVAEDLYNAITELGAVWIGQGAGAAQGALAGIAGSGSQAGSAARVMGERMSKQAIAAAEVKKMPPPQEFDKQQALEAMLGGGPAAMAADMKAQHEAAREIKAEQVRYFNAYTAAMTDVDSSTPSFGPESLGLKPTAGPGVAATGSVGTMAAPATGGAGHISNVGVGGASTAGPGGAGVAVPSGTGAGAPAASTVDVDAEAAQTTTAGLASAPGTAAAPPAPAAPSTPSAPTSAGPGNLAAGLGAAAIGGGLGFAGGKLAEGKHTGRTLDDEGEVDETGEGEELDDDETDVASQKSTGVAPMNSTSSGLISGNGTIGAGGPAGAAGAGAPMGAGAGGAGGGRGGDEEHTHASFLIEPDPDDAFGANQATPPPVIGEWLDDE